MDTEEIAFPAGVRLSGSITCPDAAGACPGVMLVGSSGPSDRHNDGFFDALRTYLAGAGVAVLAYDKRGAGKSTGTWPAATADDMSLAAAAAVAALKPIPGSPPMRWGSWATAKAGGLRCGCAHGWARRGIWS